MKSVAMVVALLLPGGAVAEEVAAPAIEIRTPWEGAAFYTGQVVIADYECTDADAGVRSCTGTVARGVAIDTGAIGENVFQVTATDVAGNAHSLTRTYKVIQGRRTCGGPLFPRAVRQRSVEVAQGLNR
jgi:hypothetical protein